jgi:receptor protein-tyrosine kinase
MSRVFEAIERARRAGANTALDAEYRVADASQVEQQDPALIFPRETQPEARAATPPAMVSVPPPVASVTAPVASVTAPVASVTAPVVSVTAPVVTSMPRPAPVRPPAVPVPLAPADQSLARKLITSGESPDAFTEYRRLAATLFQTQVEHQIRTVMVTSAMPAEGKSLTAANLALTLANAYRKSVLLIDGDTRRPTLHQIFGGSCAVGFLECLRHGRLLPSAAVQVAEGLDLLAGGTPWADPVSELSSPKVRDFFADAGRSYDWIVVDTPPAVVLPDAELLASVVDACLLVIQAGRTPFKKVQRVIETLGRERFVGVVLNRAENADVPGADYGHYYSSRYQAGTPRR